MNLESFKLAVRPRDGVMIRVSGRRGNTSVAYL